MEEGESTNSILDPNSVENYPKLDKLSDIMNKEYNFRRERLSP